MLALMGSFCAGLLFAMGLGIAGMTLPQKVLAFLDVTGDWDPSLGLVGLCPGPAVAALASLHEGALVFFVSMIAGMYAYGTLHVIGSHDPDGGASALDLLLGKH